jgi:predicted MFS family arabinose efflux permease
MNNHTLRVILPIAAIQFIYLLDFIVIMPLVPDIAKDLNFSSQQLTWLSAAYTLASVVAGILSIRWLDRLNKKPALLICFAGLAIATALTALAQNTEWLIFTRALTGFLGSPTVALAMSIVIDTTPPAERGKAIGKVMLGFSLATIGGIPLALEIAHHSSWHTVFYTVAGLAVLVNITCATLLPNTHAPQATDQPKNSPFTLLKQRKVQIACLTQAFHQMATFLIVPIFTAFMVFNLNYPREHLGMLYLAGGLVSMLTMQMAGRLSDRTGPILPYILFALSFATGLLPLLGQHSLPIILTFVLFMSGNGGRTVSLMSFSSQVPAPKERASYLALQNVVQDAAVTFAAVIAGSILSTNATGQLQSTASLSMLAIACALAALLGLAHLRRIVPKADSA